MVTTAALLSTGAPFSPGNAALSGGLTLSLAAGAVVTIASGAGNRSGMPTNLDVCEDLSIVSIDFREG